MYYLTNLTRKKCSAVRVNNTEYLDTENWKQKISTPRKNQRLIDAVIIIQYCSIYFFLFLHSIHYPCTTLALTPGSNSDSGSHRGSSSPLPTTIRAFIFIARSIHRFSPSATHVKCYLPTLLSAPSSWSWYVVFACLFWNWVNSCQGGIQVKRPTLVVSLGSH